jgi:hypothetical protein
MVENIHLTVDSMSHSNKYGRRADLSTIKTNNNNKSSIQALRNTALLEILHIRNMESRYGDTTIKCTLILLIYFHCNVLTNMFWPVIRPSSW